MAMTVLSILLVFNTNLQNLTADWNRGLGLVVFLENGSTSETLESVAGTLEEWPEIQGVESYDQADAFDDLARSLGDDASLLDGLDSSVLPSSVQVVLMPDHRNEDGRTMVAQRIQELDASFEVERVDYGQDMVGRTEGLRELVNFAGWAVGILVLVAVIFIITNTVRLTLFARREEIEVMQLVGASHSFIRIPFYLEGAFQGGIGALFAIGFSRLLLSSIPVDALVGDLSAFLPEFHFLSQTTVVSFVCGASFMGVVASHLATGRFLKRAGD